MFKGFVGHNIVSQISKLSVRRARKLRRCKIVVLVKLLRFRSADEIEKIRITGRAGRKCRVGVAFHFCWIIEPETEAGVRMWGGKDELYRVSWFVTKALFGDSESAEEREERRTMPQ